MSRITRASASRLCGRIGVVSLAFGVLAAAVFAPGAGRAVAEPASPDGIATLVTAVANANQKLQDLGAAIQTQQESVNKALVDVQTARDAAAAAQQEVTASQAGLTDANAAIAAAQKRFDGFAASTYMNGPSASYVTATDPADIIDTAATGQTLSVSSQQVITNLQRARTEQVNRESAARLAKQKADQAVVDAQTSQDSAVTALTQAQQTFGSQKTELDQLTAERSAAQAKLDQARLQWSAPAGRAVPQACPLRPPRRPRRPPPMPRPTGTATRPPRRLATRSGTSGGIPRCPPSPVPSSAATRSRSSTRCSGSRPPRRRPPSRWAAASCRSSGSCPTPSGYTNGAIPRVYGRQASEYVIRRAGSQMGVPYSWGGGNAVGPSRGIDSGAGTTGFDCSGLILYAFAGVGIKLPHYSGAAVRHGPQDPVIADAKGRRDLLRPRRQPARDALPRQRPDARSAVHRFDRQGLTRADQRHDAVRDPLHRILMVVVLLLKLFRRATVLAPLVCALVVMIGAAAPAAADPDAGAWDPTLPKIVSSGAPGDPVALANASFQASQIALQTTQSLGQQFLSSLGLGGSPAALPGGRVRGPQAIEYVIRRGGSQMGVPYSWGGGALNGPSAGVDYDAGKIGYDCSGLTRYAFAGVGVQIPKYSGRPVQQRQADRAVASQARRPDLLRPRRKPARRDLPGRRQDARGLRKRRTG